MLITVSGKTKFHNAAILKTAHAMARELIKNNLIKCSLTTTYAAAIKWAMKKAWIMAREEVRDLGITGDNGVLLGHAPMPKAMREWIENTPSYQSV